MKESSSFQFHLFYVSFQSFSFQFTFYWFKTLDLSLVFSSFILTFSLLKYNNMEGI